MAVPPEAPLDALALHRLVARDDVLHVAGEQVPVVRQPVRERRPVVEDELVRAVHACFARLDARVEGLVALPVSEDVGLEGGEGRA